MKRSRFYVFIVIFALILLTLACNLTNLNKSLPNVPETVEKTAQSVVEQVAETAVQLPEVNIDTAATLAALAGNFSIEDLKNIIGMVQLGADGTATLTITEAQVNTAIQVSQAAADTADPNREKVITDPKVAFTSGNIILTGKIVLPPAELRVVFKPYIENGKMKFEVVEASLGGAKVPAPVASAAELIINDSIGSIFNNVPQGVALQSVSVGEGTLTVVAAKQ